MPVINGTAAFISLKDFEVYQGKSTEKYSITVTLDDASIEQLEGQGVKLRSYEDSKQRKFASKFLTPIYEANGDVEYVSFLDGPQHLYNSSCLSVRPSLRHS